MNGDEEVELKWHNFYQCPRYGTTWEDEWDCQCNDECPNCGIKDIQPYESEEIV